MGRLQVAVMLWTIAALAGAQPAAGQTAHAQVSASVAAPPGFLDACRRHAWLCGGVTGSGPPMADDRLMDLATRVNRRVNGAIVQVADSSNYGVDEHWALPANGRGDCEDLALLKKKLLLDEGVAPERLMMAVALDRRGDNHAVLLLRLDTADVVLDSASDRIVPWGRSGYTFLARQRRRDKAQWGVLLSLAER